MVHKLLATSINYCIVPGVFHNGFFVEQIPNEKKSKVTQYNIHNNVLKYARTLCTILLLLLFNILIMCTIYSLFFVALISEVG